MCTREPAHTELGRDITLRDDLTPAQLTAVTVLLSIALWNAFEMVPLVFFTFKRFRTLYFWSICAATLGVMMCTTSQFISTWGPAPFDRTRLIASCISCIGWAPMVTGQSLVLYSRLHLLNVSPRTLKIVRFLIILDGVTLHTIGTAFTLEPLITHSTRLEHVYKLFEKIQITAFMAQEFMLSGIYLWKAHELLGQFDSPFHLGRSRLSPCRIEPKDKVRNLLFCLIVANVMAMLLDVSIIVLEFAGLHEVQLSYKTFAYALKLKIELGILNQLVGFVRRVHSMNTEANMNARMEGEWQTTLERTFATESHH
ncbi:hypothetical protein PG999_004155 [Apiospora kogelbergensis]|uniref:DUF7703 domain-containing protein n=1 Tax=Apiospora kogelbergensis TaxID=1337665 RepID=A0AAW0R5M5_9PEZI